jgi:MoxR-like ATPase
MEASHDTMSVLRARAHESKYENLRELRDAAKEEVRKVVVGQDQAVELLLVAALAHGHVLIEGPPGSAKTLLSRAMAHVLGSSFKRIQFTPDTTPTHIIGQMVTKFGENVFLPGPIFANVVLADEVNRTPPRTQAAMLEAMQEQNVTVVGKAFHLEPPFLVLATQNPIEQEGTYPLPEAQLDRFMFLIELDYPSEAEEVQIGRTTTGDALPQLEHLLTPNEVIQHQHLVRRVPVPDHIYSYAARLVRNRRARTTTRLGHGALVRPSRVRHPRYGLQQRRRALRRHRGCS